MKKLMLVLCLALSASSSFAGNVDVVITDGKIQIVVRGSGGFVCSAQDSFKKIPVLGRGETQAEAEMNAKYGASVRAGNGGDVFFSRILSCEPSASGSGKIVMTSDNTGTQISVEGPSAYQCIAQDTFRRIPFVAKASTLTEASALASSSCAADAGDSGFFCDSKCEKLAGELPRLPRLPKLPRLPRL